MAGVYHFLVDVQTGQKYNAICMYGTTGSFAPTVVYIETAVFFCSLHIQQGLVYTSHFLVFSRLKPGGGVNIYGVPTNGAFH